MWSGTMATGVPNRERAPGDRRPRCRLADAKEVATLRFIIHGTAFSVRESYAGGVVAKLGIPVRIIKDARRPRQTVMLTQHCPGVFGPEQPALLQDRDHLGTERVELRRQQGRHDIE